MPLGCRLYVGCDGMLWLTTKFHFGRRYWRILDVGVGDMQVLLGWLAGQWVDTRALVLTRRSPSATAGASQTQTTSDCALQAEWNGRVVTIAVFSARRMSKETGAHCRSLGSGSSVAQNAVSGGGGGGSDGDGSEWLRSVKYPTVC
ncbi:Uu.00g062870.m01.CDS01 [Anthostomella pinea]|uniref:Uu.00g062870.m01.CDS01 n=1 Tax=Anthostomella pinea TaxID=933095 RepID=A0AAI8VT81_9PEZI|nr:Uu.00g062870.m01.CDS01 [Anthostomella pinea]